MQTTTQDPVYSDSRHKMLRIKIDGDMVELPHDVDFDTIENSTGETLRDARDMYDDLVQRLWSEQTGNGIVKLNIEDASLEVIALGSPKRQQPVNTLTDVQKFYHIYQAKNFIVRLGGNAHVVALDDGSFAIKFNFIGSNVTVLHREVSVQ